MVKQSDVIELSDVVIKFVGDSGDGMQLTGTMFSEVMASVGNDISTFPDFPAEIRAPHNTIAGVSGFQVHLGSRKVYTPGDMCDVLVAMNPASLRANLKWVKPGAIIIADESTFDANAVGKAGYQTNPLDDDTLTDYFLIKVPVTHLLQESLKGLDLDNKALSRTKNMFILGIVLYLFSRGTDLAYKLIENKFKKGSIVAEANKLAISSGYNYASSINIIKSTYKVDRADFEKGKYRSITGNIATAWGMLAAAERSGRPFFLGSYPITPATEILMELSKHKSLGVKVFQAEDEIAGICSAIGASFSGSLAATTTSGPGFSLKSEAMGLAVITELPLVIVNVQRAGPSTGMPTKGEQSDLLQALYGRNGDCPLIIIAASTPSNCFDFAYIASKLSLEHMTPVVLLTDGYLAFSSELFKIPKVSKLPGINPPIAKPHEPGYKPYRRDENTLVRQWAIPGTDGLRHRIGGLEKTNIDGNVSTDPLNHQLMVDLREEKVKRVEDYIPEQAVLGEEKGDLLVVGWGGTEGALTSAVKDLQRQNYSVSLAQFNYIKPLPKNTRDVLSGFNKIIVCELNMGQFVKYLKMSFPEFSYHQYNKVQGLPFLVKELKEVFKNLLEGDNNA